MVLSQFCGSKTCVSRVNKTEGTPKYISWYFKFLKQSAQFYKVHVKYHIKKFNFTRYFKIGTMANKFVSTAKFHNINFSGDTKLFFKIENGLVFYFLSKFRSTLFTAWSSAQASTIYKLLRRITSLDKNSIIGKWVWMFYM